MAGAEAEQKPQETSINIAEYNILQVNQTIREVMPNSNSNALTVPEESIHSREMIPAKLLSQACKSHIVLIKLMTSKLEECQAIFTLK